MILELLAGGSIVAALAAGASVQRRRAVQRGAVWRALAEGRDGRLHAPRRSLLRREPDALDVLVEHAVVRLDIGAVRIASGRPETWTRARAAFAIGGGPAFRVAPIGMMARLIGSERTSDELEDRYLVEWRGAARHAWSARARRLVRSLESVHAESSGSHVLVAARGQVREPARLEKLLDLAGALASFGTGALESVAELPGARRIGAAGPWESPRAPRVEIATAQGVVRIECKPGRERARLELALAHHRAHAPFSVDVEGGRLVREPPRALFTDRAMRLLDGVHAGTLSGNEERVRLVFGSAPPLEAVRAGVELLGELAGGKRSVGAFR